MKGDSTLFDPNGCVPYAVPSITDPRYNPLFFVTPMRIAHIAQLYRRIASVQIDTALSYSQSVNTANYVQVGSDWKVFTSQQAVTTGAVDGSFSTAATIFNGTTATITPRQRVVGQYLPMLFNNTYIRPGGISVPGSATNESSTISTLQYGAGYTPLPIPPNPPPFTATQSGDLGLNFALFPFIGFSLAPTFFSGISPGVWACLLELTLDLQLSLQPYFSSNPSFEASELYPAAARVPTGASLVMALPDGTSYSFPFYTLPDVHQDDETQGFTQDVVTTYGGTVTITPTFWDL